MARQEDVIYAARGEIYGGLFRFFFLLSSGFMSRASIALIDRRVNKGEGQLLTYQNRAVTGHLTRQNFTRET